MSAPTKVTADTAKLPLMLTALRLPTFANLWPAFADRADREGWPAARFLAALAELELAERDRRRIQRHLRVRWPRKIGQIAKVCTFQF